VRLLQRWPVLRPHSTFLHPLTYWNNSFVSPSLSLGTDIAANGALDPRASAVRILRRLTNVKGALHASTTSQARSYLLPLHRLRLLPVRIDMLLRKPPHLHLGLPLADANVPTDRITGHSRVTLRGCITHDHKSPANQIQSSGCLD